MVVRKRKKSVKLRGSRTHGWGSPKKHRGKGSRGGKGKAGMSGKRGQQRIFLGRKLGVTLGKRGFKRPIGKRDKIINLDDIEKKLDNFIQNKIAVKKGDKIEIDISKAGYTKVLGTGRVTKKLIIKAKSFSKKAKEKIEEQKGEAIIG